MVLFAVIPNAFPAWVSSGAQTPSFLLGTGEGSVSAMTILLLCTIALTASPVAYQTVRVDMFNRLFARPLVFAVLLGASALLGLLG